MATTTSRTLIDVPLFTITEQTGDKRTLTLSSRALPYRPIMFSGIQRKESTPYAGNPVKTLQAFGPEEEPTEISGFWKDRFIGATTGGQSMAYVTKDGQQTNLLTVIDLVNLADDMRRKGQKVLVQWGPVVRRGIIERLDQKWHNVHDVEWTIKFEFTDQNDPEVPAVIARDTDYANSLGTLGAKVQAMLDKIASAVQGGIDVAAGYIAQVTDKVQAIGNLVTEFSDTISNATDLVTPILDQQRRLAGICDSIQTSAEDMMSTLTAQPSVELVVGTSLSTSTGDNGTGTIVAPPTQADPDGAALAIDSMNRELFALARDARTSALTTQMNLLKAINPNILAVFIASDDGDLRDVSTFYFQTQSQWRSIMVFNGMDSSALVAGDTVFVPNLYRSLDGGGG